MYIMYFFLVKKTTTTTKHWSESQDFIFSSFTPSTNQLKCIFVVQNSVIQVSYSVLKPGNSQLLLVTNKLVVKFHRTTESRTGIKTQAVCENAQPRLPNARLFPHSPNQLVCLAVLFWPYKGHSASQNLKTMIALFVLLSQTALQLLVTLHLVTIWKLLHTNTKPLVCFQESFTFLYLFLDLPPEPQVQHVKTTRIFLCSC